MKNLLFLIVFVLIISTPTTCTTEGIKKDPEPANPLTRYSLPEIKGIWSDDNRFGIYRTIEGYVCEIQEKLGIIPLGVSKAYWNKTFIDVPRIREIEQITAHETIAFLTSLAEQLGEPSKYVHYGMTSSDILDTGLNVQIVQSLDLILTKLNELMDSLKKKAFATKNTLAMGRSHGVHGEPISMGLKFLHHYSAFARHRQCIINARKQIAICSISGAMGNFTSISPKIEAYVAKKLNFQVEPIATQVIPRDRYAHVCLTLGSLASSIEMLALEIRHMQRTEVGEWMEPFNTGQKGSSAMPHKRNPILSENLTGLSRLIRSAIIPSLENVPLWHERDISHSSVERIIIPQSLILTHFALHRLNKVIVGLRINKNKVKKNLRSSSRMFFSQNILLALIKKGLPREQAYKIIQAESHKAFDTDTDLEDVLINDTNVLSYLSKEEIHQLFDEARYMKNVDYIFDRVLREKRR